MSKNENEVTSPQKLDIKSQQIQAAVLQYSSPLPPPEVLQMYENTQPGLITKIIEMTEVQGNHRRRLEEKRVNEQINHQKRIDCKAKIGQVFAFIISMSAIILAAYLGNLGYPWPAGFIGAFGLTGLVGVFIHGRHVKSNSRESEV